MSSAAGRNPSAGSTSSSPTTKPGTRPTETLWNESYYLRLRRADGSDGGLGCGLGLYPNRQLAWWTTWDRAARPARQSARPTTGRPVPPDERTGVARPARVRQHPHRDRRGPARSPGASGGLAASAPAQHRPARTRTATSTASTPGHARHRSTSISPGRPMASRTTTT